MRERFVTLLCAVGALLLFLTMFFHGGSDGLAGKDVARPTTEERGPNGYHAAFEWLTAEHVRTVSLRDRYDKLPRNLPRSDGNLLLVTLPAAAIFKTEEFRPLDRWVRQGNTLFVVAALSDHPEWVSLLGSSTPTDLNLLTGLDFETARMRDARLHKTAPSDKTTLEGRDARDPAQRLIDITRKFDAPRPEALLPNLEHPYFRGVHKAVALSDFEPQAWTVKIPYEGFVLSLGRAADTGEGAFWTRPLGKGRIVVSGLGSLFTNRALGLADNARLLSNIIATDVAPGGTVMFDDVHQGLGTDYDPARFYRDPRLHLTIGIVALLWLSWVLGATRLRVPVVRTPAPREVELVRATGGFLARVLAPEAAARRLFDLFLRRCPWEVLERQPRIPPAELARLKSGYASLGRGRVPLVSLHNLMIRINRRLDT